MQHNLPEVNFPLPTPSGVDPAIARREVERRNTLPTCQPSRDQRAEMFARGLAERHGCYIDNSIIGLVIRSVETGQAVAQGFHGFQALITAAENGEITWEVRHGE